MARHAGYNVASLDVPANITLIRLPPYAPELNPMENLWAYPRANKLAITLFNGYDDPARQRRSVGRCNIVKRA